MSSFLSLLPPAMRNDETVKHLAAILDVEIDIIDAAIGNILIYSKLNNHSEHLIDELARSFHMLPDEGYRFANTLEKKRELLKSALTLHRHKGTLYAVKEVLRILDIRGEVLEWFQYGGEPYKFKVDVFSEGMTQKEIALLEAMINQVKNVRSHIDVFNISLLVRGRFYTGAAVTTGEQIHVKYYFRDNINITCRVVTPQASVSGEYISVQSK